MQLKLPRWVIRADIALDNINKITFGGKKLRGKRIRRLKYWCNQYDGIVKTAMRISMKRHANNIASTPC